MSDLIKFPHCRHVAISVGAFVPELERGKGVGTSQHRARLQQARNEGYKYILCTVRSDNPTEIHILAENGWQFKALVCGSSLADPTAVELWGRRL